MKRKIFTSFVILILIGVLTTGVLALSLLKTSYLEQMEDKLITNGELIVEFLSHSSAFERHSLDRIAKTYSEKIHSRLTFVDKDGWVLGDSDADINILENHKNRPEIQIAYKGRIGKSVRYSKSLGFDMLYVALPLESQASPISVVRLSIPLQDITAFNKTIINYIVISAFGGIIVAILLGMRFVNGITEPIRELTIATRKLSHGNYGERVYLNSEDELRILADNFNIMSQKLEDTIKELRDKNTKMTAILTSMKNGVIAIDNLRNIIFINPNAEEIFGFKEEAVIGKHILALIRNNFLDESIQQLLMENVSSKTEIEIMEPKHRILNLYSNSIKLEDNPNRVIGAVIIIQDITEIRKLERIRKDFVANVSHELKTPLTSIKGFIETLKDGASENKSLRDKFLDIIDIEANRLNALIADLLTLSEIENKNSTKMHEKVMTNQSIEEVIQIMDEVAKQKNIIILNKVNNNLPSLYGNGGWFKQMLINLIDNGIKYTPKGGTITVIGYNTSNRLVLKIKDTGIGVEKKHLSRLFERFYRVDKARSRQVGGTGLGLAITKHIVLSFEGDIQVKSKPNVGTEFTIRLPIKNVKI